MPTKTVQDYIGSPSTSFNIQPSYPMKQQTLQDLRDDEEFAKASERFLTSLGKGDTPDDLFEYFRGADFNLVDATKLYSKSKNFTEQQKLDYIYLRNKFDNASVGGLAERLKVTADITGEMLTDPVTAASVLFIPWTGGASVAARVAGGKAVQAGLKKLAGQQITKNLNQVGTKIPFQKLKTPLTKKGTAAILATEGFTYGSIDDYMRQGIEIETDQRARRDTGQTLAAGAITGAGAAGLYGLGLAATRLPKFQRALQDRRIDRIDNNDNYKADIIDTGSELLDKTTDFTGRVFGLFTKPTSRFIGRMKKSKTLEELVKIFRYDADKRFVASELGKQERLGFSFNEDLQELVGNYNEELFDIINPLKTKGTIQVPAIGSRDAFFKLPFGQRAKTKITKEGTTIFGNPKQVQRLDPEVNDDLFYYLNTEKITKVVNGKEVPLNKDVVKAGMKLRRLLDKVRNTAGKEGVDIYRRTNYFPRKYIVAELKDELENPGTLTQEIMRTQNIGESQALKIIQDMIDNRTFFGASIMDVVKDADAVTRLPGLSKERVFSDIDDVKISKYLDTDIETVLADYIHQSSALIARKKYFGINVAEFKERYIDKIQAELGAGNRLNAREIKDLVNIYKVTTGQQDPIKSPTMRAVLDGATVINQMALLPFATITSLSEIAVPILKGAGKKGIQRGKGKADVGKGGTRIMFESIFDYGKFWWNDIVQEVADVRSKNLVELNRLNRAMTTAGQDRALAMFGQGVTQKATQAQNVFFKYNLLHDWTRFVQLTSYEVGKSKIYENLYSLANKNLSKTKKLRLQDELNELGVDIEAGIKWVKDGANPHGIFYKRNFTKSAARYVDEVVMNPTAASNQKPLLHSYVTTRWLFGLMGFPTAFSNTVLKNGIRDITRDVRQFSKGRFTTPGIARVSSGVLTMTAVGAFGNILRTGGKELDKVENGEISFGEFIGNASRRTGLWGPLEQYARIEDNRRYRTLPDSVTRNLAGPVIGDIIDTFDRSGRTSLQITISKIPGVTVLRSTNPQAYEDLMQWAKENDPLQPTFEKEAVDKGPVRPRPAFQVGGLVTQSEFDLIQSVGEDIVSGKLQEEVKDYVTEREKQRATSSKKVLDGVKKGDYRAAFEAYETLPIGQQLAGYINPVTNVPLSVTGAAVYAEKSKPRMKTVSEYLTGIATAKSPLAFSPVTVDDPLSAGIAVAEASGAIPFFGGIGKVGAKGLKRFKSVKSRDDFGGEGGGGSDDFVKNVVEIDNANFKSRLEEEAIERVKTEKNAQALVNYLKSPKRKGLKKEEKEYINLDNLEITKDTTPEDVIKYIQANKPRLYRAERTENPSLKFKDADNDARAYFDTDYYSQDAYYDSLIDAGLSENAITRNFEYGYDVAKFTDESNNYFEMHFVGNSETGYKLHIFNDKQGDFSILDEADVVIPERGFMARDEGMIQANRILIEKGIISESLGEYVTKQRPLIEQVPNITKPGVTLPTEYGPDKYSQFTLPNGDNYREFQVLIENAPGRFTGRMGNVGAYDADFHLGGSDELLHYRTTDRLDKDGKKILFIEEIQSDIHQAGRKFGYNKDNAFSEFSVPPFPFQGLDWVNIAVKDAANLAAKEGYDKVAFVPALIQAQRNQKSQTINYETDLKITDVTKMSDEEILDKLSPGGRYTMDGQPIPKQVKQERVNFQRKKFKWMVQVKGHEGLSIPTKNNPLSKQLSNYAGQEDVIETLSLKDDNDLIDNLELYLGEKVRTNPNFIKNKKTQTFEIGRMSGETAKFVSIYSNAIPNSIKKELKVKPYTSVIYYSPTQPLLNQKELIDNLDGGDFVFSIEDVTTFDVTPEMKQAKLLFKKGGIVRQSYFEGEKVSEDFPVTDVAEEPANRVDPFTGAPYKAQMEELGL